MNAALRRIAFGMGLAVAAVAALLSRGDGPLPDDADLMVTAPPVADHENGFITLIAAAELLRWPDDDAGADRLGAMARGAAWDDALAERALAANEFALHAFARVARNVAFQSPAGSAASRDALAALDLSRLLAIRAISAARRGEPEAAIEDALLIVRTGSKIGANPNGGLLYSEMGFTIGKIGLRAIEAMSPGLSLTSARSVAISRTLSAERAAPAHWRAALAADYRFERARLAPAFDAAPLGEGAAARIAGWLPSRYVLQPNNTLAERIARVRLQQAHAHQPCDAPRAEVAPLSFSDLLRPNALGRRSATSPSPRDRIEILRCGYDARVELTRAALGVLTFERERGALPPSLDALVPAVLDSAPVDPFSGAGLRFDRTHRVLYSVGSDGIDESGRELDADDEDREPRLVLPTIAAD